MAQMQGDTTRRIPIIFEVKEMVEQALQTDLTSHPTLAEDLYVSPARSVAPQFVKKEFLE